MAAGPVCTEPQAANTLAGSMHAEVTAQDNTIRNPLWPSNTRQKDDRVWVAARTGNVLVTAPSATTSVAQSPNGAREPSARRSALSGALTILTAVDPWPAVAKAASDMCPPTHAHSLRPALCRSGHVSWIGLDD